jgi:steroid delta-isomerase-like uncharacterized protein
MTPEENKAIRRRYYDETWGTKDIEVFRQRISSDVVDHLEAGGGRVPGGGPGIEGAVQRHAAMYRAFPDATFTIEDMVAEDDKVSTRFTIRGTHLGEIFGIPPTGKKIEYTGIDIVRMVDGKTMEHWVFVDRLRMMQQLGAVQSPALAGS